MLPDEVLTPTQEAVASVTAEDKAAAAEPVERAPDLAVDPAAPPEVSPEPAKRKSKIEPWMQARLDEKTYKQREAERERDAAIARARAAEALAESLRKPDDPSTTAAAPKPATPPADFVPKSEVESRAAEMARAKEFSDETHRVLTAGRKEFPDGAFDEALAPLQAMGAVDRLDFLEAAFATGEAHKVLHHLGNNPDEASKLLQLTPIRMAAEMAKIAGTATKATKAASAPVSNAPRPAAPLGGTARAAFDPADPSVSMEAFSDWFDRELGPKILRRG